MKNNISNKTTEKVASLHKNFLAGKVATIPVAPVICAAIGYYIGGPVFAGIAAVAAGLDVILKYNDLTSHYYISGIAIGSMSAHRLIEPYLALKQSLSSKTAMSIIDNLKNLDEIAKSKIINMLSSPIKEEGAEILPNSIIDDLIKRINTLTEQGQYMGYNEVINLDYLYSLSVAGGGAVGYLGSKFLVNPTKEYLIDPIFNLPKLISPYNNSDNSESMPVDMNPESDAA